jgi:hypothetical protein
MPDYLAQRQNAISTDPQRVTELNRYLETVADAFGQPWLKQTGSSPVQELWNSKHAQATNELLILGHAIQNMQTADASWTRRQIALMKTGSRGEQSGATFEIIGLNLFTGPGQRVVPAAANKPGYDGSIVFDDGASLMVSIKNHGITSHETGFLTKAEEIRSEFVDGLRAARANPAKMRAIALRHPSSADWAVLKRQLRDISSGKQPEDSPAWEAIIEPLPAEWSPLSPNHLSYGFILAAPFHPNEQKNFEDSIRKGITNMEKNCTTVAPDVCRTILLRLSATASMPECAKWANDYFAQYPDTNVELIMLYQAVPAMDLRNNTTPITHFFLPVLGPHFARWQAGRRSRRFAIHPLIGAVQINPTGMVLLDGVKEIPFDGHYVFQKAEVFHYYDPAKGSVTANLSNPAPGVFHHAVIGDLAPLGMRASEDGRLLLLP